MGRAIYLINGIDGIGIGLLVFVITLIVIEL